MSKKREAPEEGVRSDGRRPSKKQRTYTAVDAQLAKLYEDLASELNDVRITAATGLVNHVQAQIPDESDARSNSPLQSQRKIFLRLIRGLCSSRKAARMGFSIALTEIFRIALQDSIDSQVKDAIALIEEQTSAEGGASGQEKRDYALGRLTALSAILRSGALQASKSTSTSARLVVDRILSIYTESPLLAEECGIILGEALQVQDKGSKEFARATIESLVEAGKARTPEGITIWLDALQIGVEKLPKDVWHHRDPLNKKEWASVFKIIRQNEGESSNGASAKTQSTQSGTRRHAPHYAWNSVLRHVCARNEKKLVEQYWAETFDKHFFNSSASPEKKALGFQNFTKAISWLPAQHFDVAFSQNLVKTQVNQSSQPQRYLHAAARTTLAAIVSRARHGSPSDVVGICRQLLTRHGTMSFDRLTGTKTGQDILRAAQPEAVKSVVETIFADTLGTYCSKDAKSASTMVQSAADNILSLVRSRDLVAESVDFDEPHWILSVLEVMGNHAFLTTVLPEELRSNVQSRLFSILSHILSSGIESALEFPAWLMQWLFSQSSSFVVLKDADDAVRAAFEQARITFEKLIAIPSLETSDEDIPERRVLRLLFSMTMLQAYAAETDAIELLPDLQQCYNDVLGRKGKKARGIEAIMDVIMDFASRHSVLHRKLAEQVFSAFAPDLTADSLDSMLQVLEQKENVAGQQALFDGQDDADGASAEDEDGDADNGDDSNTKYSKPESSGEDESSNDSVDVVEAGSHVGELDSDDDDSAADGPDTSEEENDEDGDEDGDELAKFDALLASTLKTDDDQGTFDSDADMDDEQMMALEPHLTAIFRERAAAAGKDGKNTQKKAQHKSAKENISAFKNRVLDLLQIYVRQCADGALATRLILPLLRLVRTTGSKQVAGKAHGLLKSYFDLAKKKGWGVDANVPRPLTPSSTASDDGDQVPLPIDEHLAAVHDEALLFASRAHAAACSSASLFLARGALVSWSPNRTSDRVTHGISAMDFLVDLYAATHRRRLSLCGTAGASTSSSRGATRGGLPASFWEEWVRWSLQVAGTTTVTTRASTM